MPDTYRAVLFLRLEHGLTVAEIAETLGRSPATIRVQLQRGLAEALALHAPAVKDARAHVAEGKRAGLEWEGEVPTTDPGRRPRGR